MTNQPRSGLLKAFILTTILLLSATSCEKSSGTETISVSAPKTTLSASGGADLLSVTCSGSWSLMLFDLGTGGTPDWATLDPDSGSGNSSKVLFTYEANETYSSRSLRIILSNGKQDASCEVTQSGLTAQDQDNSGGGDGGSDDDGDREDATACGWLELPATVEGDGLSFYYHTADFSGTTFRNYSFYWDKTNHLSRWVAYPLNAGLISSGSRTEAWGQVDPLVPSDEQSNMANSYKNDSAGNSYDRGHQLPSADRLDYEPNRQTFYPTNMTPQLSKFNQNIWANLESMVRTWAKNSDTLYVVTGCVIDGYTTTTTDRDGLVCPVPLAYYKALLRYSSASTYGNGGYIGIGFYLEHKNYDDQKIYSSYAMSIDDLEEKVGVDFFVNLPAKIGETAAAAVEKQGPSDIPFWSLTDE